MRYLVGLVVALAACNPPAPDGARASTDAAPDAPSPRSGDRMPEALLGTYDVDAAACSETTTMGRLVVSPDTLDFYYGYATVNAVAVRDGGYDVDATLYHLEGAVEVVPRPTTYRVDPAGGGLRLDADGEVSPLSLVRCAAGPRPDGGAASPPASGDGDVQSRYTQVADCETIETFEKSGGSIRRCAGYDGTPLYVTEGDLRYDVDVGVRNDAFTTPSGFNALGKTVEWRLRDGEPFAVIVRYQVEGPGGTAAERRSDLAVLTVGREGAPGCLVGYVEAGAAPDQNTAARRLADRAASGAECAP